MKGRAVSVARTMTASQSFLLFSSDQDEQPPALCCEGEVVCVFLEDLKLRTFHDLEFLTTVALGTGCCVLISQNAAVSREQL